MGLVRGTTQIPDHLTPSEEPSIKSVTCDRYLRCVTPWAARPITKVCRRFHNRAGDFTKISTGARLSARRELSEPPPSRENPAATARSRRLRSPASCSGILLIQRAPIDPAGVVGLHGGCGGLPPAARGSRGRNSPPGARVGEAPRAARARERLFLGPGALRAGHLPHRGRKISSPWEEDAGLHRPPRGRACVRLRLSWASSSDQSKSPVLNADSAAG